MPVEIEKKYRLTQKQRRAIEKRLRELGIKPGVLEFEENTLYRGGRLDFGSCALRLRRVNGRAILTFKQRLPSKSMVKHQQEDETEVADAGAVDAILQALGFRPALIYEKRRTRWQLGQAELVIDELPFGLFMEVEATERGIARVESQLGIEALPAVLQTYPMLTARLGKKRKGLIEARFPQSRRTGSARKRGPSLVAGH